MLFDELVQKGKIIRPPGSPKITGKFRVTQVFGCTKVDGEPPLADCTGFHRGIDIGDAKCGSPVFAAHAGRVQFADELGNKEKVVIINHFGGWGSSYGHLSEIAVSKGQDVVAGQRIGSIGDTGNAKGCHLHLAVKSDLPAGWTRRDFIPNPFGGRGDSTGRWHNPWPLLVQNVRIHPRTDVFEIRIRTAPELGDTIFATTESDGTIRRSSDNASLGEAATPRLYGGQVVGASYSTPIPGKTWEKIELGGAMRFIATPLAVRSAT